jgi:hypothetical protein
MNTSRDGQGDTQRQARRAWQPPSVVRAGTVSSILRQQSGKVSATQGDPGDGRKNAAGGES